MKKLLILIILISCKQAIGQNSITITPSKVDVGKPASVGTITNQTSTAFNGAISLRFLQHNYSTASIISLDKGDAGILDLYGSTSTVLHGISGIGIGTVLMLYNNSNPPYTITLKNQSFLGVTSQRFITPGQLDIVLNSGEGVIMVGNSTANYWRVISWTK